MFAQLQQQSTDPNDSHTVSSTVEHEQHKNNTGLIRAATEGSETLSLQLIFVQNGICSTFFQCQSILPRRQEQVDSTGFDGALTPLSGGIDSTATAHLGVDYDTLDAILALHIDGVPCRCNSPSHRHLS
ncbi:hypothetical protein [Halocatena pleomorpha]|uniref:Uncharacterized protein n=1 Tax=Halocatena pleomorpha TaxID=1785090 RepID=A0A3P3R6E8_9EURY|nr:hypothetical protein [Halocatena pleomorpha]RRJ29036.1 hypothetical protein EIK79_14080 [Halocatena pleomorpha]